MSDFYVPPTGQREPAPDSRAAQARASGVSTWREFSYEPGTAGTRSQDIAAVKRTASPRQLANGTTVEAPPAGSMAAQMRDRGLAPAYWDKFSWEPGTGISEEAQALVVQLGLPQPKQGEEFSDAEVTWLAEQVHARARGVDERLAADAHFDSLDLRHATREEISAYATHKGINLNSDRGLG
jgi:hypothetical protein